MEVKISSAKMRSLIGRVKNAVINRQGLTRFVACGSKCPSRATVGSDKSGANPNQAKGKTSGQKGKFQRGSGEEKYLVHPVHFRAEELNSSSTKIVLLF